MNTIKDKLAHCFSLTFPKMDPAKYPTASAENTAEWDSIKQVTLLSLIGEEFSIDMEMDFEEFEDATSFEALANRISELTARGA